MDAAYFDSLVRSLDHHARRAVLGVLGGGLAALLSRRGIGDVAARKGKKKLKRNAYGCVNVGGKCRGKDAVCCSGVCAGKKPKKGEKDKSRCAARHVLECQAGADSCLGDTTVCATDGSCYQTTGQASFCGRIGLCVDCKKDADCANVGLGPSAACVVCPSICPGTSTLCILPAV